MSELPDWLRTLADRAQGLDPTELSRFLPPEDGSGRQSAVLIVLSDSAPDPDSDPDSDDRDRDRDGVGDRVGVGVGPAVLLIERSAQLRQHAGQIAFPGGSLDPTDAGPDAAALREAQEEVGLDPASVQIITDLPALFIPVTGFVVTPVLAWWRRPHPVHAVDAGEVAGVQLVSLAELADPANRFRVAHPSGLVGPGFAAGGLFIWGFTAGLLDRLLEFGGWAQPWDTSAVRPLPPQLSGRR